MGDHKKNFILVLSILAGGAVYFLDALFDYLLFYKGSFLDLLILNVPVHEIYIRLVIVGLFVIFGIISYRIVGRLEESRKDLRERSEQLAILNKELEAFNYSVSQDLKVPLRHIQGYCELISENHDGELSEDAIRLFAKATEATKQMRVLIDNLIQLSKAAIFEVRHEPVDLTIMVQQISRDLQAWDPGSKVQFEIGKGIFGNGDETLLRIALFSLIGKAWKLSRQADSASISFNIAERGQTTYALVQHGSDVNLAEINTFFDPAYNLHWDPEEEALGLSVAARIIRKHGGNIWAEKIEEKSLGFFFTLSPDQLNGR